MIGCYIGRPLAGWFACRAESGHSCGLLLTGCRRSHVPSLWFLRLVDRIVFPHGHWIACFRITRGSRCVLLARCMHRMHCFLSLPPLSGGNSERCQ